MKNLAMLVVAAMAGVLLVACGESAEKRPMKTEVIVEQPVAPVAAPAPEVAPAPEAAAPEAAAPSEGAAAGAETAE